MTWDLIWINSMCNHGAAAGYSQNAGILVVLVISVLCQSSIGDVHILSLYFLRFMPVLQNDHDLKISLFHIVGQTERTNKIYFIHDIIVVLYRNSLLTPGPISVMTRPSQIQFDGKFISLYFHFWLWYHKQFLHDQFFLPWWRHQMETFSA